MEEKKEKHFGIALRFARVWNKMTQKELAALGGIPRKRLNQIESGRVDPRVGELMELFSYLGVSLNASFDFITEGDLNLEMLAKMPKIYTSNETEQQEDGWM